MGLFTRRQRPTVDVTGTRARLCGGRNTFPDAYRGVRKGADVEVELRPGHKPPWPGAGTVGAYVGKSFAGTVNGGPEFESAVKAFAAAGLLVTARASAETVQGELVFRVLLPHPREIPVLPG